MYLEIVNDRIIIEKLRYLPNFCCPKDCRFGAKRGAEK